MDVTFLRGIKQRYRITYLIDSVKVIDYQENITEYYYDTASFLQLMILRHKGLYTYINWARRRNK
jgi:hypothetical protein